MYFNLQNKFVKRKKIRKTVRKHSNLYTNETANSYFEICLKRCEKRQEGIPHRPMQKINKFTKVFRIFFRFTNLFRKLKYI